jgi:DNA-binding NtrC family response regulator
MADMTGLGLLRIVREKYPEVVRMVLSGYTQVSTVLTAINEGQIYKYITKPWRLEEQFKPAIHDALEYYDQINGIKD